MCQPDKHDLYRAVVPRDQVEKAMVGELRRITYGNFKDTVKDQPLHDAYLGVWNCMAKLQNPLPFDDRGLSIEEEAHVFATGHMPPDAGIDTSDIPEADEAFFRNAKLVPKRSHRPNDHTAWSPDKRKPAKRASPAAHSRRGDDDG